MAHLRFSTEEAEEAKEESEGKGIGRRERGGVARDRGRIRVEEEEEEVGARRRAGCRRRSARGAAAAAAPRPSSLLLLTHPPPNLFPRPYLLLLSWGRGGWARGNGGGYRRACFSLPWQAQRGGASCTSNVLSRAASNMQADDGPEML